jgi:cell filamentation protein
MGRTRAGFPFHFRAVHHHLFQDVYDWAGRDGKLRLTKGTSTFLLTREHRRELKRVFGWLKAQCYLKGRTAPNFAAGSAHFLGELNALHAFREGNGRAQLSFMALVAQAPPAIRSTSTASMPRRCSTP